MCVCKYVGSSTSVLETVLSVVQITQMLLRLLALFREWEWRELVPEPFVHADAARGNCDYDPLAAAPPPPKMMNEAMIRNNGANDDVKRPF
ncbi:Hypothetical protein, putative [Bodo saltans]|uniref:Uncharacterized protein n=1 Tax=Bodo saltans TaxID=75058 RepID=A0A0S4JMP5_BODSA|nr:Hypothetical protein, putative [Bodo saltans]|eukprot:CUG92795.1 Hypothetical protein, putative [Bodo saltans]